MIEIDTILIQLVSDIEYKVALLEGPRVDGHLDKDN